jgi:hypothetical protein
MKAVTGNRLANGRPVYRTADGEWTDQIEAAELFDNDEDAQAALDAARGEETRVVGTYLITIEAPGQPAKREAMRENIRAHGPTITEDRGSGREAR